MKDTLLTDIVRADQTVFSFKELFLMWGKPDTDKLKSRISYYISKGYLYHLRRGLYAKTKEYSRYEVATKIMSPSYISFETVLLQAGVIFQFYDEIFVATYQTRTIVCDGQTYTYRRLKNALLSNLMGILVKPYYSIATPERAFLDMVYLHKEHHFDSLSALDWNKVYELLPIYKNKRMEKSVHKYYQDVLAGEDHDYR